MKKIICVIILFFHLLPAQAWELEGYAGAQTTTYDDVPEANNSGISARAKINFYNQNKGVFVNLNDRGISLYATELFVGYGWRTQGPWFFEGGAGISVAAIFGTNIGVLAGSGYRVTNNLFINFPIILAGSGLYWSPYIGYSF